MPSYYSKGILHTCPSQARPTGSGTAARGPLVGGPAGRQVCAAAGEGCSDGRLERDDVCPLDQVFILAVDQRVPLVEILF